MRERGILMTAQNVRWILAGTKTQTRRIQKPQPIIRDGEPVWPANAKRPRGLGFEDCPYGEIGNRLFVRENGWERTERTPKMMREGADTWAPYYYDADGLSEQDVAEFKAWGFKRRPSIHMPRWASRITLEITDVRVERLQEISEADAYAEGIEGTAFCEEAEHMQPATGVLPGRHAYRALWESINGPGSWELNPWVWAISFRRVA